MDSRWLPLATASILGQAPSAVIIAALTGLLALALVNAAIIKKENLLEDGALVYLELAPVDPRSLMQGDYMALNYKISNEIRAQLRARQIARGTTGSAIQSQDGTVVVTLDEESVGHFTRLGDQQPLGKDERSLAFRVRDRRVKFATDAFFFQEGTAQIYAKARYGEFRVAADGELLLTGMRDKSLQRLGPSTDN